MSETSTLPAPPPKAAAQGAGGPQPSLHAPPPPQPNNGPHPLHWTVATYVHAIEAGAFPPTLRAELLRGQIIERMSIGIRHAYTLDLLIDLAYQCAHDTYIVRSQGPAVLGEDSRVEPDLMLLEPPRTRYATVDPVASDILLLCEVADSSLHFDRTDKLSLYAEAGVREYWILNVRTAELERYTDPRPDGSYAAKAVFAKAQTLQHERLGDVELEGLFSMEPTSGEAPEPSREA